MATTALKTTHAGWRDYLQLCKPNVVALIVFTAVVGMLLAAPGMVPLDALVFGTLGIGLAAGSAAAVNHVVDQKIDAIMGRTRGRPLPQGAVSARDALIFALAIGALAMAMLGLLVNPLTALLTFLSLIGYAIVYTAWLKRATPQNIVIGGAAGAFPPVIGWAGAGGLPTDTRILEVAFFFLLWQIPHFWLLLLFYEKDYTDGGLPSMFDRFDRRQIVKLTFLWIAAVCVAALLLPMADVFDRPALALVLALAAPAAAQRAPMPNFVVIFLDDCGYGDFSHTGNPTIHTPNVTKMVHEGANFPQFYTASPACSASRYAFPSTLLAATEFTTHSRYRSFPPTDSIASTSGRS